MKHLEKFPIILGGDHEYASYTKRRDPGFWVAGGTQRNFVVNLDDVHTFRLILKYLQNFSSPSEGHGTLNEICAKIEDSTIHVKFLKMRVLKHYRGHLPCSVLIHLSLREKH
jgi:hypothetical protein